MRLSILWTAYLSSRLPCHPSHLTWTREHVIPKSVIPGIAGDPRNIIPLPREINNARGVLPYTDDFENGVIVRSCHQCPNPGHCIGSAVITPSGVNPPSAFKGPIARSVLYSVAQHPKLTEFIHENILDIDTAIKWDSRYPMSRAEKQWIDSLEIEL